MEDEKNQWYTNKDLFELITGLKSEMKDTRNMIRQYNGLREEVGEARKEIDNVKGEVEALQAKAVGRSSFKDDFLKWGGWVIGVLGLVAAYITAFSKILG